MTPTAPVRVARLTALFVGLLGLVVARPMSMTNGTLAAAHHRPAVTAHGSGHAADASARAQVDRAYGRLPLGFESNVGQTDASVDFMARGTGYVLFLTAGGGATFVLAQGGSAVPARPTPPSPPGCLEPPAPTPSHLAVVRLTLPGATSGTRGRGEDPLPGKVHYLTGSNRAAWRTNVATYERVRYAEAYPGIDLVFYGNQSRLEYDFVVRPGADPETIALQFDGADDLDVDADGNLMISVGGARLVQQAPMIYQERAGGRESVAGGYTLRGDGRVGVTLGPYDVDRDLVIDPVLVYSTFLGGAGLEGSAAIAVDATAAAYVTGYTYSSDFPTTSGAFDTSHAGSDDAFVTKLSADGTSLAYSTYLGGTGSDAGVGIAVDATGAAYVTGFTRSGDFPTTTGAYDTSGGGNAYHAFVTKLSADGSSLAYSTYLAGSSDEEAMGIAVDAARAAYITGFTSSSDFPTTSGAFDTTFGGYWDAFVTKLSADGSSLTYSTYLGGWNLELGSGIAVDATGAAYVTGSTYSVDFPTTSGAFDISLRGPGDIFIAKVSADGRSLAYSTYLGGMNYDWALGIAVDATGAAYITGFTPSSDFPTTSGAFSASNAGEGDGFVTKLNGDGGSLAYSTYFGGRGAENPKGIAVDTTGAAHVTGLTASSDFPTTSDAFDSSLGGYFDGFVIKLSANGSDLAYSTYLGGFNYDWGNGIAVDAFGAAYVAGSTESRDFPTTSGAFDETWNMDQDAFVAKIATNQPPTVDAGGPYSVTEGGSVVLAASGSDPDHDTLTFAWDLDNDGTYETPGEAAAFSAAGRNAPESYTIRVRVTDAGGLTATGEATVQVTYAFTGFFRGLQDPPVVNDAIAGKVVAVMFSLHGDHGLAIFAPGYPTSQAIACDTFVVTEPVEVPITGPSSLLIYKAATDRYQLAWKTTEAWAHTCRRLDVRLADGTDHVLYFRFE